MGASVEITLEDIKLEKVIQKLARGAVTGVRLMRELSLELAGQTQDRFVKEQAGPDGTPWERSQRAIEQGGRGKTLIDTALLKQSITPSHSADMAQAGTNKVYAAIHQFGGDAGRNKSLTLPARPYLGVSESNRVDLEDVVLDHLERLL